MTVKLLIFLLVGTMAMGMPILKVANKYRIGRWKATVATFLLTVVGTLGTFLMYYIENRMFGGLSFYGAVFLVPMLFIVISLVLRIPYGEIMDLCAMGECVMLALMKIHCIIGNCCLGRILFEFSDGMVIRFPSRLTEMTVALILFVILYKWAIRGQKQGKLYAWFLMLYGITRFILNIFREQWTTRTIFLPFGNIWSLVAIVIAGFWLAGTYRKNKNV